MQKEEQIYLVNQLRITDQQDFAAVVNDWALLSRLLIDATFIQIDFKDMMDYHPDIIQEFFADVADNQYFTLTVGNPNNVLMLQRSKANLLEKIIIDKDIYQNHQQVIDDYQVRRLEEWGIYGYARSYDEYLYNNTENIEKRKLFETTEEIQQLPKMLNDQGVTQIDTNQLPGCDLFYDGLCLTACWRMFFSKYYFRIILKQILLDIQQVEAIQEHANDLIEITLFKKPLNWDLPANLNYQQLFRDQLGVDQLVWTNGVGVLKDPFIEYSYYKHTIQTVQYQNNRLQPTEKKRATHFVTRYYDLLKQTYKERRVRGLLNSQAYFPLTDEMKSTMMNYKILNPLLTMDEGLAAYEFYIRNYLEINVKDENYQNYLAVLKFYIPNEALQHVPVAELRHQMKDIKIGRVRKNKGDLRVDLKKGTNHLRVVFASQQKLEEQKSNRALS
ncbi:hypothetical protein [Enterococcus sp. LJL90]